MNIFLKNKTILKEESIFITNKDKVSAIRLSKGILFIEEKQFLPQKIMKQSNFPV